MNGWSIEKFWQKPLLKITINKQPQTFPTYMYLENHEPWKQLGERLSGVKPIRSDLGSSPRQSQWRMEYQPWVMSWWRSNRVEIDLEIERWAFIEN